MTTAGDDSTPHEPGQATAIARSVRQGEVAAADVLAACIRRHDTTSTRLNALVQVRHRDAAAEAAAIDAAVAARACDSLPLAGVPISVKECFPVRGLVTTLGIPGLGAAADDSDADLVVRLRAAGAVVVGKGNVPQAMYLHEADNPVWGRTLHPRDPARGPGGSSGGDAALVAAGVVPVAVGNDLAGSLRQPAHACGIATLMPRSTCVGGGGAFDTMPRLRLVRARAGFLARVVDDLAAAFTAVTGPLPTATRPARIAWWDHSGPIPASPAVLRAVQEAVARLEQGGIEVSRVTTDFVTAGAWLLLGMMSSDGGDDVRSLFGGSRPIPGVARLLAIAGLARPWRVTLSRLLRAVGSRVEAEALLRTGRRTAAELAALAADRDALAMRLAAAVAGCDAIVCPVSAVPALRHGTAARLVLAAAPCLLANLLDLAAGVVPVTVVRPDEQHPRRWSIDPVLRAAAATDRGSAGLPVGVQVIAAPGRDEATVLEVMRLIERSRPQGA